MTIAQKIYRAANIVRQRLGHQDIQQTPPDPQGLRSRSQRFGRRIALPPAEFPLQTGEKQIKVETICELTA
jgi:hypothetical protein